MSRVCLFVPVPLKKTVRKKALAEQKGKCTKVSDAFFCHSFGKKYAASDASRRLLLRNST